MAHPGLSLAVVGTDYPNKRGPGRRFEQLLCKPGDQIDLRPEPNNPADPRAVAVYSMRGVQMGYLTAERAPWLSAMIQKGRTVSAVFQARTDWGIVIRVAFDGAAPLLPEPTGQEVRIETDWWPDEEPPEDC